MAAELEVRIISLLQKIENSFEPRNGSHVRDLDLQRTTILSAEYARWLAINGILSLFQSQNRLMHTYDLDDNWRHQLLPLNEPTSGLQQSRLIPCITNCPTLLFEYHVVEL